MAATTGAGRPGSSNGLGDLNLGAAGGCAGCGIAAMAGVATGATAGGVGWRGVGVGSGLDSGVRSAAGSCRFRVPKASRSRSTFRSRFLSRSLSEGRSCATTPAPVVTSATVTRPRKANFSLERSMALRTPSVRVMTEVDATPASDEPVPTNVATRIVESTSDGGTTSA